MSLLKEEYMVAMGLNTQSRIHFMRLLIGLRGGLDANNEGLLEFKRSNPQGIENQAWKRFLGRLLSTVDGKICQS